MRNYDAPPSTLPAHAHPPYIPAFKRRESLERKVGLALFGLALLTLSLLMAVCWLHDTGRAFTTRPDVVIALWIVVAAIFGGGCLMCWLESES